MIDKNQITTEMMAIKLYLAGFFKLSEYDDLRMKQVIWEKLTDGN